MPLEHYAGEPRIIPNAGARLWRTAERFLGLA
jgi:hypothetical protein